MKDYRACSGDAACKAVVGGHLRTCVSERLCLRGVTAVHDVPSETVRTRGKPPCLLTTHYVHCEHKACSHFPSSTIFSMSIVTVLGTRWTTVRVPVTSAGVPLPNCLLIKAIRNGPQICG